MVQGQLPLPLLLLALSALLPRQPSPGVAADAAGVAAAAEPFVQLGARR
jgi:hypothetical protein